MISLTYKIKCDGCGGEKTRILDIQYVTIIDRDNASEIFKLLTPALPKRWVVKKPIKAGEPDRIFCCVECMTAPDENRFRQREKEFSNQ